MDVHSGTTTHTGLHAGLRGLGATVLLMGVLGACADEGAGTPSGGRDPGTVDRGYGLGGAGAETEGPAGDDGSDDTDGTDGAGSATGPLTLAETDLGQVLVDAAGMTLYVFTDDSPGTSTCEDACLDLWPPVEGEVEAGEGVTADLLGTLERSDGTIQASYAERPLYYFAPDSAAGDTTGQGFNGVWFVVGADGEPIETSP